jgi:hypothetical protein
MQERGSSWSSKPRYIEPISEWRLKMGRTLSLLLLALSLASFPSAVTAEGQDGPFIGSWRVIMIGLADPKTGVSKLTSPESRHYIFNIDRTGQLRLGTSSAMFAWTWDGRVLMLKYHDGRSEKYSSVIASSSNGQTSLGLGGDFDFNTDGRIWTVTMSLWKE